MSKQNTPETDYIKCSVTRNIKIDTNYTTTTGQSAHYLCMYVCMYVYIYITVI